MKASQYFLPTTKEDPNDAVVESHKLMIRAGLIRRSGSGLYHYLPLGLRILKKIESIIREEMNSSGALEFQLPILTPSELWETSGRWDRMGKEMFRLTDRHGNMNCLGPTHEESFSSLMKPLLKSYKDLPINIYQIHTKFRDEIRPRFGVIRSREFTMKDAYSYHIDESSLEDTYQLMRVTYRNIFNKMGLTTIPVQADSGSMGGSKSEEFMVLSSIGEETLMVCSSCGYNGNIEKTPLISSKSNTTHDDNTNTLVNRVKGDKIHTPHVKSIEEVSIFLGVPTQNIIKSLALIYDDCPILVYIPGDRELNESKLKNHLGAKDLRPMDNQEMLNFGLVAGFIGPNENNAKKIPVILDRAIDISKSYVVGSNEIDFHNTGFVWGSVQENVDIIDLCFVRANDPCPNCGTPLITNKGIEVGHIFQLGQKYAKAFDISVLDSGGKPKLLTMGCYGIGVNRCMATIIEQCNDNKGIFWPISVAPFEICMVSIAKSIEDISKIEIIYSGLITKGLEVFWDDRDLGPGFKFKDSELIGFPIRLTLGKGFLDKNEINILNRKTGEDTIHDFTGLDSLIEDIQRIRIALYKELQL